MALLLHHLISESARKTPAGLALRCGARSINYTELAQAAQAAARGMLRLGLQRGERVAIWLDKREEAVLAMYGAAAAGLVFVPVNPLLKAAQAAHIVRDSGASLLVSTDARLALLAPALAACPALRVIVQAGAAPAPDGGAAVHGDGKGATARHHWEACMRGGGADLLAHASCEGDIAALLYASCGSGQPRGRMLSHRKLVAGAASLAGCIGLGASDRVLALMPFSADHGLRQLNAAFASGAAVVLSNHLFTRDIPEVVDRERVSVLSATPTLWLQLADLAWSARPPLRAIYSSGGAIARETGALAGRALLARQVARPRLPAPA